MAKKKKEEAEVVVAKHCDGKACSRFNIFKMSCAPESCKKTTINNVIKVVSEVKRDWQ